MKFYSSLLTFISEIPIDIANKYSFINKILVDKAADYLFELIHCLKDDIEKNLLVISNDEESMTQIQYLAAHCNKYVVLDAKTSYNAAYLKLDKFKELISNQIIKKHISNEDFYKRHQSLKEIKDETIHHFICKEIFNNIDETKDSHNYFWVHIDHNDTFSEESNDVQGSHYDNLEGSYIRLSVLSNNSLEYDGLIFEMLSEQNYADSQVIRKIYRPYFIEYYIDICKLNNIQKEFWSRDNIYGRWFKARFASDAEAKLNHETLFEGVYAHSASPVVYKRRKLVIEGDVDADVLNSINRTYKLPAGHCSQNCCIQNKIKEIYKNVNFNKVRIYKVGNGNCVYSYGRAGKKEKRLLYDIGFDNNTAIKAFIDDKDYPYAATIRRIRNFIPHCIIISHWDADHYKACAYGNNAIFDCTWIAPDIEDAAVNAKRLGVYLYKIGKMMFVDRTAKCKKINVQLKKQSELTLYLGKNGGDLSKINCEGIAIKHENEVGFNKKIRCLMQGDVSYRSLPPEADFTRENPYEYLVVPHHGSKMDYSLLSAKAIAAGKAVICCNNQINQNRPTNDHLKKLKQCYGEVVTTEEAQRYIQLNLRNKDSMTKV